MYIFTYSRNPAGPHWRIMRTPARPWVVNSTIVKTLRKWSLFLKNELTIHRCLYSNYISFGPLQVTVQGGGDDLNVCNFQVFQLQDSKTEFDCRLVFFCREIRFLLSSARYITRLWPSFYLLNITSLQYAYNWSIKFTKECCKNVTWL